MFIKESDRDLYLQLVRTTFRLRYKGSILGFLWVLMKPFFMFLILFMVFSATVGEFGGLSSGQYAIYLLIGLVLYTFFEEGVIWGMGSILERANVMLKINFRRDIAVISSITMALINFFINMLIITVFLLFFNVQVELIPALYTLFIVITMFLGIFGISFFLSIWLVHLRDLTHIMELVMRLLFYASAVFFPVELIPDRYKFLVELNPLAIFIHTIRQAILFNNIVNINAIGIAFVGSLLLIFFGRRYFKKNILKIAEHF